MRLVRGCGGKRRRSALRRRRREAMADTGTERESGFVFRDAGLRQWLAEQVNYGLRIADTNFRRVLAIYRVAIAEA